ncbi:hypothetical protein [Pacificispira sp.]|uniref:hypothetical protein n=1 Tax=Pacificispira sp. TaxID=2888761 RepID=UPI003BAD6FBC
MTLPVIPLVDIREGGAALLCRSHRAGAERLLVAGKRKMSAPVVTLFDGRSSRWAARTDNPYRAEIAELAAGMPRGIWFMNFCYEWGCTTAVAEAESGGMSMRRTLDWPFDGLGRELIVAHQTGAAGEFYNITWPGFAGLITGMAPGRFSLAINQAPLRLKRGWPVAAGWLWDRVQVGRSRALPPAHLARRVFETCTDYTAAVRMIRETPIALPALFSLAGTRPGEGCVIEHLGVETRIHAAPEAVANDWLSGDLTGHPRGKENATRRARIRDAAASPLAWLAAPILNADTRMAAEMDAGAGTLMLRGYEKDGAATELFVL